MSPALLPTDWPPLRDPGLELNSLITLPLPFTDSRDTTALQPHRQQCRKLWVPQGGRGGIAVWGGSNPIAKNCGEIAGNCGKLRKITKMRTSTRPLPPFRSPACYTSVGTLGGGRQLAVLETEVARAWRMGDRHVPGRRGQRRGRRVRGAPGGLPGEGAARPRAGDGLEGGRRLPGGRHPRGGCVLWAGVAGAQGPGRAGVRGVEGEGGQAPRGGGQGRAPSRQAVGGKRGFGRRGGAAVEGQGHAAGQRLLPDLVLMGVAAELPLPPDVGLALGAVAPVHGLDAGGVRPGRRGPLLLPTQICGRERLLPLVHDEVPHPRLILLQCVRAMPKYFNQMVFAMIHHFYSSVRTVVGTHQAPWVHIKPRGYTSSPILA